jgi:hypothetical protein
MKLSHLLLYCKGWYPKTDDIWNDLNIVLRLDGFTPFTNQDCLNIILNNLPYDFEPFQNPKMVLALHPANCWRFGYVVKGNFWLGDQKDALDYDYNVAIVKYVVSELRFLQKGEHYDILPTPDVDQYYKLLKIQLDNE